MARGFKRRGEVFVAKLDGVERGLVVGLMEQVHEMVAPAQASPEEKGDQFDQIVAGIGGMGLGVSLSGEDQDPAPSSSASASDDPALRRLFPSANREDDQAAAEFRRLTEHGLRSRKAGNLAAAIGALTAPPGPDSGPGSGTRRVELDREQAVALVVALTDVRLVLGERLGLRSDDDMAVLEEQVAGLGPDDPTAYAVAVYDFLTWLQETLAEALSH